MGKIDMKEFQVAVAVNGVWPLLAVQMLVLPEGEENALPPELTTTTKAMKSREGDHRKGAMDSENNELVPNGVWIQVS